MTAEIIGAFYAVYDTLGYGFNEKVYENALLIELQRRGVQASPQTSVNVYYQGTVVGHYILDILVNDTVIVELKATRDLAEEHAAQLLNYLKATKYEVGLLLNFGVKAKLKRKAYDNDRKGNLSWLSNDP
ncbi:MAG: GxxExxY protein [Caldilineaceae bacterium]